MAPLLTVYRHGHWWLKTHLMLLLEESWGQSVESLIEGVSDREAGTRLNIHYSTICKWRKRLHLDGSE